MTDQLVLRLVLEVTLLISSNQCNIIINNSYFHIAFPAKMPPERQSFTVHHVWNPEQCLVSIHSFCPLNKICVDGPHTIHNGFGCSPEQGVRHHTSSAATFTLSGTWGVFASTGHSWGFNGVLAALWEGTNQRGLREWLHTKIQVTENHEDLQRLHRQIQTWSNCSFLSNVIIANQRIGSLSFLT